MITWHKIIIICWMLPLVVVVASNNDNVRIYLLTGQSNMVGEGCEAHLDHLVTNDPTTYGHLKDSNTGNWTQHPNVNVTLFQEDVFYNPYTALQPLTSVGQGRLDTLFGPEVGIGWTLAEQYPDSKILLIKVAWGGIDLAIHLRPPSSSILYNGDVSTTIYDKYGSSSTVAGQYYNYLVSRTQYVLSTLPVELYGNSPQLDGIFFLQGWNDLADKTGDKMREYEYNLQHFITDLRRDLNATTDAPFVVGEAGHHGNSHDNRGHEYRVDGVRQAQKNIGRWYPQFFCNAQMAETAKFVIELQEQGSECPVPDSCECPEYHYYNNAELFYKIGVEMGTVMISFDDCILPGPSASPSTTPTGAPTIIPPTESPMPSPAPSDEPTIVEPTPPTPTASPTTAPSTAPSASPSSQAPSSSPSMTPNPSHDTESPTESPEPSPAPTDTTAPPTESPEPSPAPTYENPPTESPEPSPAPTYEFPPTESPEPSPSPTRLTENPTLFPTSTIQPSESPSESPISRQLQRAILTLEEYLEPEFDPSAEENRALWEAVSQMIQVAQLQQSNE